MKKSLLILGLLFAPLAARAQVSNPDIVPVPSAPSSCGTLPLKVVQNTNQVYGTNGSGGCQQIGGGGGSLPSATYAGQMLTATGSGNTYTAATAQCSTVITDATHVCITAPPYNASNAGLTTTTTSATFAVGTSGSVASCSTFSANQGVLIAGAGAAAANYVGTVVSCNGTTLTVNPATSTSVASGVAVKHDETAAIQAAITAGATTGITIYFPDGWYYVNGPLQDTSGANAILTLPHAQLAISIPTIAFQGFTTAQASTTSGATIASDIATTGNILGAYYSSSSIPNFTNYIVQIDKIGFNMRSNPTAVAMNLTWAEGAWIGQVRCDTGNPVTDVVPTNTTSGCLYLPSLGNSVNVIADRIAAAGVANGVIADEHADIHNIILAQDINGLIPDSGPSGNTVAHNGIHVGYMWCQTCTNELAAGQNPAAIQIDLMDIENGTGHGINDPNNYLTGRVNYLVMQASGAVTPLNPATNGAANLCLNNIVYPGASTGPCVQAPTGIPIQLTNLVDNFPSQEGGGTTLLNTGSNSTNNATANSVTWANAVGFNGKVATYNGTTSFTTATANNTYDGTTPFSACAFISPSSIPQVTHNNTIVGAESGTTPFAGWRMDMFAGGTGAAFSGAISVDLINNSSTNLILVRSPYQVINTVNANYFACFTYDGSKTAAGVKIYVNGASQTPSVGNDTLTSSILASVPVTIGSVAGTLQFFPGAIGRVRIFSRVLSAAEIQALYTAGPNAF